MALKAQAEKCTSGMKSKQKALWGKENGQHREKEDYGMGQNICRPDT